MVISTEIPGHFASEMGEVWVCLGAVQGSGQREKFTIEETKKKRVLEEIRVDGVPKTGALRWG